MKNQTEPTQKELSDAFRHEQHGPGASTVGFDVFLHGVFQVGRVEDVDDDDTLSDRVGRYIVRVEDGADHHFLYRLSVTSEIGPEVARWLEDGLPVESGGSELPDEVLFNRVQHRRIVSALVGWAVTGLPVQMRIEGGDGHYFLLPEWAPEAWEGLRSKPELMKVSMGEYSDFPAFCSEHRAAMYVLDHLRKSGQPVTVTGLKHSWHVQIDRVEHWHESLPMAICWAVLDHLGALSEKKS